MGTDTVTAKEGRRGRNRDENGKRGGRREQVGHQGTGSKSRPLVEDVFEYWESYEGGVAD